MGTGDGGALPGLTPLTMEPKHGRESRKDSEYEANQYQESKVRTNNNKDGNSTLMELPDARCENIAPVVRKKKPAYAHSFSSGNLGTSKAITPKIFQTPSIVRKYTG